LVVSAAGILGEEICRQLVAQGKEVRGLVRATSDPAKLASLRGLGVSLVEADLKDPASLLRACDGARVVVSAATATRSRGEGDSIWTVDRDGQLHLLEAARRTGVEHYLFESFPPMADEFPLQTAKRAVEEKIRSSGVPFTILQPVNFMEVWLGPFVGFDWPNAKARVFGAGTAPNNWIAVHDVARLTVAAIDNDRAKGRTLPLGGSEALGQLDVVKIFEELSGRKFEVEHMPIEAIRGMLADDDLMTRTAAGLMLNCSRGDRLDLTEVLDILGVKPEELITVRDYATRVLRGAGMLATG
jgi:uncharacterized protein YbjT (DUF2867 family)